MKKQNFFQFLLLLISALVFSQEKEIEFLIPSIQSDITIDGVGNEKEWGKSDWQSEFWLWRPNDSLKANKQTRFKVLKNEKNLYVFIELFTDGIKFSTPSLKRDFDTFGAEAITLLFDTFNDFFKLYWNSEYTELNIVKADNGSGK